MTAVVENLRRIHIQDVERTALETVSVMQLFVDVLRGIPEFIPKKTRIHSMPPTADPVDENKWQSVSVRARLMEQHPMILLRIQKLYQSAIGVRLAWTTADELQPQPQPQPHSLPIHNPDPIENSQDDRISLAYDILLPLLETLKICYEILDRVETPPLPTNSPQKENHRRANPKPLPPIGMLSISNYTDVACFVQFCVVLSFHVLIPRNALGRGVTKVVALPKSLAGRMPLRSLQWAQAQITKPNKENTTTGNIHSLIGELRDWICSIGELLWLDRFRPMLLPRHLMELYAALFYWEHLLNLDNSQQQDVNMQKMRDRLLNQVDTFRQAECYRSLLSTNPGTKPPAWLQMSVSSRLNELSRTHLPAILATFVVDSSSAKRLSKTLVTTSTASTGTVSNTNAPNHLENLIQQLVVILDTVDPMSSAATSLQIAGIETFWSILELLPADFIFDSTVLREHLSTPDTCSMIADPSASNGIAIVRRWKILLSFIPSAVVSSSSTSSKVLYLWFQPNMKHHGLTLLDWMLRLATMATVPFEEDNSSIAKSDDRSALLLETLQLFTNIMLRLEDFHLPRSTKNIPGLDVFTVGILHAICPSSWDLQQSFLVETRDSNSGLPTGSASTILDHRVVLPSTGCSLIQVVTGIEPRATIFIKDILASGYSQNQQPQEAQKTVSEAPSVTLASHLFRLLLLLYLGADNKNDTSSITEKPFVLGEFSYLLPMVCLPLLCENCPPKYLLTSVEGGEGIFEIMSIIFRSTAARLRRNDVDDCSGPNTQNGDKNEKLSKLKSRFAEAVTGMFPPTSSLNTNDDEYTKEPTNEKAYDEMLLSTCSILLSLLNGILELGAKSRPDESSLQSFKEDLQSIAEMVPTHNISKEMLAIQGELAEMASHAVVLLVSRNVTLNDARSPRDQGATGGQEPLSATILQAEADLKSSEPALRARGMVSLRHFVNAWSEMSQSNKDTKECVLPMDKKDKTSNQPFEKVLSLAISALNDKESYVYLAAVHTIVALADVDPKRFVPVIGSSIITGDFYQKTIAGKNCSNKLSLEQRAKLTEAVIFLIRRRGSFDSDLHHLLEIFIFGSDSTSEVSSKVSNAPEAKKLQELTHTYFTKGSNLDNDESLSVEEYWNEVGIRVKTGGPLFVSEENDLVRSSIVSMVSELVSVINTAITARYCTLLISCCIEMIVLEQSRPVRRAGALLARELYDAVVREQTCVSSSSSLCGADIPMAVAMVESREDVLGKVLERCLNADDLNLLGEERERFFDPATAARCQEALTLRSVAVSGGIFAAGRLFLEERRLNENPIARILQQSMTGQNDQAFTRKLLKIEEMDT
jgi:hypothetical protein